MTRHHLLHPNNVWAKHSSSSEFLIHNGFARRIPKQTIKPIPCHHFTTYTIIKVLKSHFRETWSLTKGSSSKLEFYNTVKHEFCLEQYLILVDNFHDRANLTKLRISAHELEIELGRRRGITRQDRHCRWCKISMGTDITEDEEHFLYNCDLYASLRHNTQQRLTNLINSSDHRILRVEPNFMNLLHNINNLHRSMLNHTKTTSNISHSQRMTQGQHEIQTNDRNPRNCSMLILRTIAKFITLSLHRRSTIKTCTVTVRNSEKP